MEKEQSLLSCSRCCWPLTVLFLQMTNRTIVALVYELLSNGAAFLQPPALSPSGAWCQKELSWPLRSGDNSILVQEVISVSNPLILLVWEHVLLKELIPSLPVLSRFAIFGELSEMQRWHHCKKCLTVTSLTTQSFQVLPVISCLESHSPFSFLPSQYWVFLRSCLLLCQAFL